MTPAEIEAHRRNREAEVKAAWEVLALNPSFLTAWNKDICPLFLVTGDHFRADDQWNPIAAAKRDGAGAVIKHIAKRLGIATARLDEEDISKPSEAPAEFQGIQP